MEGTDTRKVRLLIAECSVTYTGRGRTSLDVGTRLIMLKRDGSVSVHSDDRAYKPLNWMLSPCRLEETVDSENRLVWLFTARKETLEIVFHDVEVDFEHDWDADEPGLIREWTEPDLQAWIAANVPVVFGEGWVFVAREFPTGAGPVDLLVEDPTGLHVVVEVKRTAHMPAVDQLRRYVDAVNEITDGSVRGPVRGVLAALEFKTATLNLAGKRNLECVEVQPAEG